MTEQEASRRIACAMFFTAGTLRLVADFVEAQPDDALGTGKAIVRRYREQADGYERSGKFAAALGRAFA